MPQWHAGRGLIYSLLLLAGCGGGSGPASVAVPDVTQQTQSAATALLSRSNLTVGAVTTQSSSTVAIGAVISENPAAGVLVARSSAISLIVSSGTPVPGFVGATQAMATTILTNANLALGAVSQQPSSSVAIGHVISETPAAGTLVSGGSAVSLVISSGVAVPSVVGQTQAAATSAITSAGLTLGMSTRALSTSVPAGSVISESPTAGSRLSPGTAVNLVISSPFLPLSATMTTPRAYHTATLLPNGRVLISGGLTGVAASVLNAVEVYDPGTEGFSALTRTMNIARFVHAATLLPNGQVLITGGDDNGQTGSIRALNSAELYDPVANAFTTLNATMTTARVGHTATLLPNGQVLIAGGDQNSSTPFSTAELYDPVAQTFTALTATLTSPRAGHTATLLADGQVLLTGGGGGTGPDLNSAELYDPVAKTFTALTAKMSTGRNHHTATLLSNDQGTADRWQR